MTILDHLWDDTLAGPQPEKGLGKLRKHSTFSFRSSNSGNEPQPVTDTAMVDPAMRVTRSIMIAKPAARTENETPPSSPAGATPPVSPFPGGRSSEAFRFRRKSTSESFEKASGIGTWSPRATYDL